MSMQTVMTRSPVMPVVAVEDSVQAPALARALLAGGLSVIEVTLRTEDALAAVAAIARDVPGMAIGVGTITRGGQVSAARDAGAGFLVSPGYSDSIVDTAERVKMPLLPGVSTASELMRAQADGFNHVKFFPAVPSGGTGALKAFSGPFPAMRFCPTGGVHSGNYMDFLQLPNVPCVGGSWLTPTDAIAAGNWSHIEALAASVTMDRGAGWYSAAGEEDPGSAFEDLR